MRGLILLALRVAGWAGVVVLIPAFLLPGNAIVRTPLPSLAEHLIAFAGLAFLFALVAPSPARRVLAAVALAGLAAVLEAAQVWAPGRQASVADFVAGVAGILSGWLAAEMARSLFPRPVSSDTGDGRTTVAGCRTPGDSSAPSRRASGASN